MSRRLLGLSIVLVLSISASGQSGRRPAPPADSSSTGSGADLRLEVDEVRLNVRVRDANGRPVGGLSRDNFVVAENGVRQEIASFANEQAPVHLVLVLDASSDVYAEVDGPRAGERTSPPAPKDSVLDRVMGPPPQPDPIRVDPLADLASTRRTVAALVDQLGPRDRVSVLQVGRKVELLQDWTGDREAILHAVNWRYRLGEGTALWDAVYLAAESQLARVEGQRVVVIVGDGVDTASRLTSRDAAGALERRGATAYTISSAGVAARAADRYLRNEGQILAPRRRQATLAKEALSRAEGELRSLVDGSGGALYALETASDASGIASRLFGELRAAYVLSYVVGESGRDGEWRAISVFLDRPGCTAVTRKGYYVSRTGAAEREASAAQRARR